MKLGISSWTYGWSTGIRGYPVKNPFTPLDIVGKAKDLGVNLIQYADNMPLHKFSDKQLQELKQHIDESAIEIELGTKGISPENLMIYLKLCKQFNSTILRTLTDTAEKKPSENEIICQLRDFAPELERAGVCLAIENHDRFTASTYANIIEKVGSKYVRICLDSVNSFGIMENPDIVFKTLLPYTVNLHVKDFMIQRFPYGFGFTVEGRSTGKGMLNVPMFLEMARNSGHDMNIIIEQWVPPEENIQDTVKKEQEWAKECVRYLRNYIKD